MSTRGRSRSTGASSSSRRVEDICREVQKKVGVRSSVEDSHGKVQVVGLVLQLQCGGHLQEGAQEGICSPEVVLKLLFFVHNDINGTASGTIARFCLM